MLDSLACWACTAARLLQGADRGVSCSGLCFCSQLAPWAASLPGCQEKTGAPLVQASGGGDVGQRRPPSTTLSTSRSRTAGKPPVSPVASPRRSSAFAQPGFHEGDDEEVMQEVAAALAAAKAVDKGKKPMTVAEVGWRAGFAVVGKASCGQVQWPPLILAVQSSPTAHNCHAGMVRTSDQACRGPKYRPKRMLARNRPSPCYLPHCNATIRDSAGSQGVQRPQAADC